MTHNIIDTLDRIPNPPRSDVERAELIELSRIGDESAKLALLRIYLAPILKEVTRATRNAIGAGLVSQADFASTQEEILSEAILVFYRVVEAFDPARGMRGFVTFLTRALRNDEGVNSASNRARPMRVPMNTAIMRTHAIKAADGDIDKARDLAPQFGLTKSTFDAITRVFQSDVPIDDATATGMDRNYVRIEHLQDTGRALAALDFTTRMIVESSYGLNGQPQQSNHEIAANLGISRRTVQRRLESAMLTMRNELNPEEES